MTAQAAFGRPPRCLHNLTTYFDGRTCVSPSDDFAAVGPALRPQDVAIVIPWHGVITIGAGIAEATALHVTYDYAARLDVTLPQDAPEMPPAWREDVKRVLSGTNYLALTWDVVRRKGADAFNGRRVVPIPVQ